MPFFLVADVGVEKYLIGCGVHKDDFEAVSVPSHVFPAEVSYIIGADFDISDFVSVSIKVFADSHGHKQQPAIVLDWSIIKEEQPFNIEADVKACIFNWPFDIEMMLMHTNDSDIDHRKLFAQFLEFSLHLFNLLIEAEIIDFFEHLCDVAIIVIS